MTRVITKHKKPMDYLVSRQFHAQYRCKCQRDGRDFNLTVEEVRALIFQDCHYCGGKPTNKKQYYGTILPHNGLDRKDNNLGYTLDNVVPCCKKCNPAKSNMSSELFIELAHKIVQNQKIKNSISEKKLSYYYERALASSKASPDPSTKVGALLIHGESGAVIAEGYNGFVRGAPDHKIPTTRPEKYDYIIHAETNLICNAARHGVSTDKCVIFCTISPCIRCMRMLYQAGITEVYVAGFYSDFQQCSSMLDLKLTVTTIGQFSKITVEPNL